MPNFPDDEIDWDLVLHHGFRGKSPPPEGWPRDRRFENHLNRYRAALTPEEYDEWLPGYLQRQLDRYEASKATTLEQRGVGRPSLEKLLWRNRNRHKASPVNLASPAAGARPSA